MRTRVKRSLELLEWDIMELEQELRASHASDEGAAGKSPRARRFFKSALPALALGDKIGALKRRAQALRSSEPPDRAKPQLLLAERASEARAAQALLQDACNAYDAALARNASFIELARLNAIIDSRRNALGKLS